MKGGGTYFMSRYSCKCPAPGCDFVLEVTAESQEDALKKMFTEGSQHILDIHPDFPEVEKNKAKAYALKNIKCRN